MKQGLRLGLIAAAVLLAAAVAALGLAGEQLSRPALRAIGTAPAGVVAETVALKAASGQTVAGWWIPGQPGAGAVLLLHGVRGDRREMLGRAEFLSRLGYALLLIDLPAHGESVAEHITYGVNEAEGVRVALALLAQRLPGERIGVIGVSLGAASLVLSRPQPAPAAVVLESMYPTIDEAVADRLRLHLGSAAELLAPLLLWQLPLRLGVSPQQLRPIEALPALRSALLIAAGSLDQHTTLAETRRLYAAAQAPKSLWVVDGAAHVNLHDFDRAAYEARVSAFLARHLRTAPAP